jgi:hypothetical protein
MKTGKQKIILPESVCGIPTPNHYRFFFVLEILFYSKQLKNFD